MIPMHRPEAQDVYAMVAPDPAGESLLASARVTVLLERGPGALARAFSLLCTLDLVPSVATVTAGGKDCVRLDLCLESVVARRFDLLLRKLGQLTECLDLSDVPDAHAALGAQERAFPAAGA